MQTSYGKAVMWSRGYGAEETKAAFARAQELATGVDNAAGTVRRLLPQFAGCMVRGEPESARTTAENFVDDAKNEGTHSRNSRRFPHRWAWRLALGRILRKPARISRRRSGYCDPKWDGEARRRSRHGLRDQRDSLPRRHVVWQFGEVGPARKLIDEAISRAIELAHVPTLANAYAFKTLLEMFRGDARAALP